MGVNGAGQAGPAQNTNTVVEPVQNVTIDPLQKVESELASDGDVVKRDGEKKKVNGLLIGLIVCLLFAIGGIGFGLWATMDGNAQRDALKQQVSDLQNQVNKADDYIIDDGVDIIVNDDAVNPADYIYIGEWGIKVKVPENWKSMIENYSFFSNNGPQGIEVFSIREKTDSMSASLTISFYGDQPCSERIRSACLNVGGRNFLLDFGIGCSDEFFNHFTDKENYSLI